jgi:hypothetical protein
MEQAPLLECAQEHDRAGARQRKTKHDARRDRPAESGGKTGAHQRGDGDLYDGPGNRDGTHGQQLVQREMKADAEHQEDDADLGQLRGEGRIGDEARCDRTDGDAREQVAHQRRDAKTLGNRAEDKGKDDTCDNRRDERGLMQHREGGLLGVCSRTCAPPGFCNIFASRHLWRLSFFPSGDWYSGSRSHTAILAASSKTASRMTTDRAQWWTQAAKVLSRTGLLWLALTAVALGSLVSSGAGIASSARFVAASNLGSTGKLKANGPASPAAVPGELSGAVSHRAQGPDAAARRTLAGGTPVGLLATVAAIPAERTDQTAPATDVAAPASRPSPFAARAPPALA